MKCVAGLTSRSIATVENLSYLLNMTKDSISHDLEVYVEFSDLLNIELRYQSYFDDILAFNVHYDCFTINEDNYIDDPDKYKDTPSLSREEALEWFVNWQRIRNYNYKEDVCINPYFYGV